MKLGNSKRKVTLDFTLDSSEAVMFNKGGKHTITINPALVQDVGEIEITIQLEREQQGRHDFLMKEAQRHKEAVNANQSTGCPRPITFA